MGDDGVTQIISDNISKDPSSCDTKTKRALSHFQTSFQSPLGKGSSRLLFVNNNDTPKYVRAKEVGCSKEL
jgi:hypothetical protein